MACQREIDPHIFFNLQHKETWILQAPLYKGNAEVCFGGQFFPVDMDLHGNREVVRSAVKGEDARNLNGRIAGGRDGPLIAPGRKRYFSKMGRIEDILGHLFVPAIVAAAAASSCDHH